MNKVLPVYKNENGKYIRQFIEPDTNCILIQIEAKDYVGQAWLMVDPEEISWLTVDLNTQEQK